MNTQQIIADIEHAAIILAADPSPARLAAAAVMLRAAADAIEAQSEQSDEPVNHGSIWVTTPKGFRKLKKGEAIWASDIYKQPNGKFANAETDRVGRQYDPAHYLPHFRPV